MSGQAGELIPKPRIGFRHTVRSFHKDAGDTKSDHCKHHCQPVVFMRIELCSVQGNGMDFKSVLCHPDVRTHLRELFRNRPETIRFFEPEVCDVADPRRAVCKESHSHERRHGIGHGIHVGVDSSQRFLPLNRNLHPIPLHAAPHALQDFEESRITLHGVRRQVRHGNRSATQRGGGEWVRCTGCIGLDLVCRCPVPGTGRDLEPGIPDTHTDAK